MNKYIIIYSIGLTPLLLLGQTETAWALQSHSAPEGLYVHQMAHLLFMGALAYLYWHTRYSPVLISKGWKYLRLFCILLFCWNLLAFAGHQAFEHLTSSDFINKNNLTEQIAPPLSFVKVLYSVTKMDHFLNVPALLTLTISLRTFYLEVLKEDSL
ncbi:hypothetical protein FCL47_16180 [Desulfopila sp. IMCC35006]|uniref:hypothetical protein n=1 Tax=Desulfopila sp. IMCC35006 TaxID=2569542 RepID=UPI0010AB7D91|nr:hypothetical protein [Desulfopila sp. IMCC35006]TKB24781.1 hypothetical protein FCL47_16180 [Desulfopila sp. IMCC35006]